MSVLLTWPNLKDFAFYQSCNYFLTDLVYQLYLVASCGLLLEILF